MGSRFHSLHGQQQAYKQFLSVLEQLQERRHEPQVLNDMINNWRSQFTRHRTEILDLLAEATPHSAGHFHGGGGGSSASGSTRVGRIF